MTEGRTATTRPVRRCPWCGDRCHGVTCRYCRDLELAERALWQPPVMRAELRATVKQR